MSVDTAVKDAPAETPKLPVGEPDVVHDDPVAMEEKAHDDLVSAVAKKLGTDDEGEKLPDVKSEKPGKPEEGEKKAPEGSAVGQLSQELQTRAQGAGLSDDLVERLHQSGHLEETLAAMDRRMIDYVQGKEAKEPPKAEEKPTGKETPNVSDVPTLDPEIYDEDLVKRDAYQQQRIDALEAQVHALVEGQQGGFDEWFDGVLTDLGVDTADNDKCQSVFKAYGAICDAFGKNPTSRDKEMVERSHAAMYPKDVFKQQQRKTVDRLRGASGKFLTSSKSQGAPPPKGASEEEVHNHLVSSVSAYLKEQGVQMSGV
jgi:hypothetical protein